MNQRFREVFEEGIALREALLADPEYANLLHEMGKRMVEAFKSGNKVLFCGNGGSAADAQHISAELSGRFKMNRKPLFAEALHVNSSYMTAVANDYGFEHTYSRMVEAMGKSGDILFALSTSGNSPNILEAAKKAKEIGMQVISFSGANGGQLKALSDLIYLVPSDDTARIQEIHITLGHILCEFIEQQIFS